MSNDEYTLRKRGDIPEQDQLKLNQKQFGVFEQAKIDEFRVEAESRGELKGLFFRKKIFPKLVFLGYFGVTLVLNTFTYRRMIKLVQGRFGLKAFWPIHFSIFPFMCAINFSILGIGEGLFAYFYFGKLIDQSCKKVIK